MPSDREAALRDIRHHVELARSFIAGIDRVAFLDDLKTQFAVTRCLEIISEASRRLPLSLKERHASPPWKRIAGAGNVYRHDYEDVEAQFVWETVHKDLPPLLAVVEQELSPPGGRA